jgi:predicted nucleic acid-binding protein
LARGAEPAPRGPVRRRRTVSFVDTNVLVYATATNAPFRDRARAALVRLAADEQLSVSRQILREYVAVMTRPQTWGRALSLAEAMTDAAVFERRFTVLEDGQLVWDQLMDLSRLYSFGGRQVHDANVVATMLAHGERRLLTFNEADFRRFTPLIEVVAP